MNGKIRVWRSMGLAAILAGVLVLPLQSRGQAILLSVDNGDFFYDTNSNCIGDTDNNVNAVALRHWHAGIPLAGGQAELAGGFGCLDGGRPQTYGPVTVTTSATVTGRIRYTWDRNVPGGGFNDVQLHIFDAGGNLVFSTLFSDGAKPVVPVVLQVREHPIATTLGPGTYTFVEDIFSGEHTAWLTRLEVVE